MNGGGRFSCEDTLLLLSASLISLSYIRHPPPLPPLTPTSPQPTHKHTQQAALLPLRNELQKAAANDTSTGEGDTLRACKRLRRAMLEGIEEVLDDAIDALAGTEVKVRGVWVTHRDWPLGAGGVCVSVSVHAFSCLVRLFICLSFLSLTRNHQRSS